MISAQKAGGWSAIFLAASYTAGFGLFAFAVDRTGYHGAAGELAMIFGLAQVVWFGWVGAVMLRQSGGGLRVPDANFG